MNTADIITLANNAGLATSDFNLEREIRDHVVPEFLQDVDSIGKVWWRRRVWTQVMSIGDRFYDMPTDFGRFDGAIYPYDSSSRPPVQALRHIGEETDRILSAELNTTPGAPTGYWIRLKVSGNGLREIVLDRIPDKAYSASGVYYKRLHFADYTTPVDFAELVPIEHQWAMVELLREKIFNNRLGMKDPRGAMARQDYGRLLLGLSANLENAPEEFDRYAS
jgi:hypothetical protein